MASARNLLNLKDVAKGYGSRSVLREVTLGVAAGERIGVVGRNGDGKSTLLRLIAGVEPVDAGALTRAGDVDVALLGQRDELDARRTIREVLVGERAEHEWAGDSAFRDVLARAVRTGHRHADRGPVRRRAPARGARAAAARST
jgi:ATP-binding cassette subfamily F protein uup